MRPNSSTQQTIIRRLYAISVGVAGGTTVGIVGWGGGQIIIPSMTYPNPAIANFSQLSATGLSLSSLSISTMSSGYKFWHDQSVNIPIVLTIGIPALMSSYVGTKIAKRLSSNVLALVFNGFCIVSIPIHFYVQQRASSNQARLSEEGQGVEDSSSSKLSALSMASISTSPSSSKVISSLDEITFPHLVQYSSCGVLSGVISSMIGVGGLPIVMSYLTETTDLSHHFVQGTSVCALVPSILYSAISKFDAIPMRTAGCITIGGIMGGYFGAKIALGLTEEQLRYVYMTSLVLFGGRSAFGAVGNIKKIYGKG